MEEEQVKKGFWKKLQESKWKQVCFFVGCMCVLVGVFWGWNIKIKINKYQEFIKVEDDFSWVYQIDGMNETDKSLVLYGWAFELEKNADEKAYEIILCDIVTGKGYFPTMEFESRTDVNNYFLCEYSYLQSGFIAKFDSKKIDVENTIYEILIRPTGAKNAFSTGIYCTNEGIMFVNPNEYEPLQTEGTDLQTIIEGGVLRVYRSDVGMYVYQYEGELYWIAEESYEFSEGDCYVQYQMNTTQIENLPQHRLDNGWYWSNLGFMFKDNELKHWKTGKYRVTKAIIPIEYAITNIWTGKYIDDWIWRTDFRPWYEFCTE